MSDVAKGVRMSLDVAFGGHGRGPACSGQPLTNPRSNDLDAQHLVANQHEVAVPDVGLSANANVASV